MLNKTKKWDLFHKKRLKNIEYPQWPDDNMLRILFGRYNKYNKLKIKNNFKVLDIGCGFGNNLVPFLEIGCDCYGVEISTEIINVTKNCLKKRYDINEKNFLVGNNKKIPFKKSYFDLIISSGVIHYEENEKNFIRAITEYSRVLKKNKYLYLSTTGMEHDLLKKSEYISKGASIVRDIDFRNGKQFFFTGDYRVLNFYLSKKFNKIDNFSYSNSMHKLKLDTIGAFCRKI